jgi:hypothetical protein
MMNMQKHHADRERIQAGEAKARQIMKTGLVEEEGSHIVSDMSSIMCHGKVRFDGQQVSRGDHQALKNMEMRKRS